MLKLIWISENNNDGIVFWLLRKISDIKNYKDVKGKEAEDIIDNESTDFLYINIKKPANTDVMDRLCFRNINRLRVSVFKFRPVKSRIIKFFLPPDLVKTIAQNILYDSSSKKQGLNI